MTTELTMSVRFNVPTNDDNGPYTICRVFQCTQLRPMNDYIYLCKHKNAVKVFTSNFIQLKFNTNFLSTVTVKFNNKKYVLWDTYLPNTRCPQHHTNRVCHVMLDSMVNINVIDSYEFIMLQTVLQVFLPHQGLFTQAVLYISTLGE